MELQHKDFPTHGFKVLDAELGVAEKIVAVFSNVDAAKERIIPGAFTKSIGSRTPKGCWMHKWDVVTSKALEVKELFANDPMLPDGIKSLGGLYVKCQYNLDTQAGREAFSNVKGGYVDQNSIGYLVTDDTKDFKTGIRDLKEIELYEFSDVLVGCNPATSNISAKQLEVEFKAEYLGDYIETSVSIGAISRLFDGLMWNCAYDTLYDENLSNDEKVGVIAAAFAELAQMAPKIVGAILSAAESEDATEMMGKSIKQLFSDPADPIYPANRIKQSFTKEIDTALDAVEKTIRRGVEVKELRAKDGKGISPTSLEKLATMQTKLSALLTEVTPAPTEPDFKQQMVVQAAMNASLKARAQKIFTNSTGATQ